MSRTKLGIITLFFLALLVIVARFVDTPAEILGEEKAQNNTELEKIVNAKLSKTEGHFAVYIESLATPSGKIVPKFALNEGGSFPAASLYKLVLLAAVFKETEAGGWTLEDIIIASRAHLKEVLGALDFGYEDAPEKIEYSVAEALERVGRISDNFAAIMLTEKLREGSKGKDPLLQMASELGMKNTTFDGMPNTTASDIAVFFKKLYWGEVVSPQVSSAIIKYLSLSKINDRIPAGISEGVKIVHKTGEMARLRHDAGIVYGANPYLIVLLSKDLRYEDEGVETLAEISKEVFNYFQGI